MYAYTYSQYGGPEVVTKTEIEAPKPGKGEVLVRVHATTVSAGDWRARSLTMPRGMGLAGRLVFGIRGPRKQVLGTDMSGVIEAVGEGVTAWSPGDAVIAYPGAGFGAHAEYIVMPADGKLVAKPANISFDEGAAIPFGATTAYDFLVNKAGIKAGERVLINGASGAVGTAAVQVAKWLGAEVTGVTSGGNAELVRGLGADHVIDYKTRDFTKGGERYDVVIDTVGTAPFKRSRRALRKGGRMVMISGGASDMIFGKLKARLAGMKMISGVASESREVLEVVVRMAAEGKYRPVIDRSYGFDEMQAAHAHVDSGHKVGAVVVRVVEAEAFALAG
ncbi:NAD(P)-dependent alcohol dehydrogenase [Maritimibacter dapengensis]|uniref:NAD(P)-dependent alcohol dehydrogenase n=1 Tax=Maritimibacter dapengensis TaxID=2836868 RepID=A0ABS6T4X4_9RHOB|nr:NAD(P)-dependent alcohol dehydrogenase [Maritimibacter dapengensis]MBV7379601.1 NAD(P)-dependent alcohol dehydrogenase [Maritimibacter dapengensis]